MKAVYGKYVKGAVLVWAGCFIAFLVFYLLVLGPQEKLRARTETRLAEAKGLAQAARDAAKEENKAELAERVAGLEQRLRDFVAEQENMGDFTFVVDKISKDIKLSSAPITATGAEGIVEIENCRFLSARNLSVNFTSSFNKFATFVNALESGDKAQRSRPVIFVDTFAITRSTEGESGHKVDMRLAVLVGKQAKAKGVDS